MTYKKTLGSGETAVATGKGYLVGDLLGVVMNVKRGGRIIFAGEASAQGDEVVIDLKGVYRLPKASGAVTEGQVLYWDDTAKNITTTASTNKVAGWAAAPQASGDATVDVKLKG